MIRTNLSTRPFYNERAVHVAVAVAAVLVLALTAFNVVRVVRLSDQNTQLSTRIAREQAEAARLMREAAAIRRGIDKKELESVAAAAREANGLIDERTFSWTAFFNFIEATLPPDVMLVSVQPSVRNGETRISMTILSRRTEDIDEFVEKLEATGAFEDVLPAEADPTDQGLQRAMLDAVYTGGPATPEADHVVDDQTPPAAGAAASAAVAAGGAPPPSKSPSGGRQ